MVDRAGVAVVDNFRCALFSCSINDRRLDGDPNEAVFDTLIDLEAAKFAPCESNAGTYLIERNLHVAPLAFRVCAKHQSVSGNRERRRRIPIRVNLKPKTRVSPSSSSSSLT